MLVQLAHPSFLRRPPRFVQPLAKVSDLPSDLNFTPGKNPSSISDDEEFIQSLGGQKGVDSKANQKIKRNTAFLERLLVDVWPDRQTSHFNRESCVPHKEFLLSSLNTLLSQRFYSYLGSLNEPPCSMGVQWVVFAEPLVVNSLFLRDLREKVLHRQ